jgi:hypothetical protein
MPALRTAGRMMRWSVLPMAAALILALGSSPADADNKRHKQWNQGWGKHSQHWDNGWNKHSKHWDNGWGWNKRSKHRSNNGWGWGKHAYYPRQRYNYQYYYSPGPSYYFPPPAYYYPRDRYYKRHRSYDEPRFQIILPFRFD